jgi:hypothetical protein
MADRQTLAAWNVVDDCLVADRAERVVRGCAASQALVRLEGRLHSCHLHSFGDRLHRKRSWHHCLPECGGAVITVSLSVLEHAWRSSAVPEMPDTEMPEREGGTRLQKTKRNISVYCYKIWRIAITVLKRAHPSQPFTTNKEAALNQGQLKRRGVSAR